jgi:hypothetical protein
MKLPSFCDSMKRRSSTPCRTVSYLATMRVDSGEAVTCPLHAGSTGGGRADAVVTLFRSRRDSRTVARSRPVLWATCRSIGPGHVAADTSRRPSRIPGSATKGCTVPRPRVAHPETVAAYIAKYATNATAIEPGSGGHVHLRRIRRTVDELGRAAPREPAGGVEARHERDGRTVSRGSGRCSGSQCRDSLTECWGSRCCR